MSVPILMFHEVAAPEEFAALAGKIQASYVVTVEKFELFLETLARLGCNVIPLERLVGWLDGTDALPPRSVVITFDDGYAGNYHHAVPLLRRYGAVATFFLATNKIGDALMLSWEQVALMLGAGMSVQSHTASHPLLSTLSDVQTRAELVDSKLAIETHTGAKVSFLSLPNGDSNRWYRDLAQAAGYRAGCGSEFGVNERATDRFFLRRIAVKRDTSVAVFADYLMQRRSAFLLGRAKASAKRLLVRMLTKRVYDGLYNRVFGVEDQRKGHDR